MFQSQTKASRLRGFCISNTLISDCYRRSIACNGRCPSQQCKHCCLQIEQFARGVQVRCPQKKEKARKVRAYLFVVRSTQNKWVLTHLVRCTDTACLFVCYVRCARFLQMLCACSSLCLRSTETCSEQKMLCACVSLCLRSVGRSPSCAKMRRAKYRTQASVSAEKEKTRTKFVLIFLWCGHRDLNSDGVTIRPSNVRVCLFRHDRLTLLII